MHNNGANGKSSEVTAHPIDSISLLMPPTLAHIYLTFAHLAGRIHEMKRGIWISLVLCIGIISPGDRAHGEFIPLEDLLRNTDHTSLLLSPDGRYLAGQRWESVRRDGWRLVTFTLDIDKGEPTILSDGRNDLVRDIAFTSDNRLLLGYLFGRAWIGDRFVFGGGGWRAVNADGSDLVELVPTWDRAQRGRSPNSFLGGARRLDALPSDADHALFKVGSHGLHRRDARRESETATGRAIYRVNIHTAETERVATDRHFAVRWWTDQQGEVALARCLPVVRRNTMGEPDERDLQGPLSHRLFLVEDGEQTREIPINLGPHPVPFQVFFESPFFSDDRRTLYFLSQSYSDRVAIVAMDLESFATEVIHEHPTADIVDVGIDPFTRELIGYRISYGRGEWTFTDPGINRVMELVNRLLPDTVNRVFGFDRDRRRFLIASTSSDFPTLRYFLDLDQRRLEEVVNPAPWLVPHTFSRPRPISFAARDGVPLHGYLTLPQAVPGEGPHPLILRVHGGPFGLRDSWRFDPEVQFLADRGYAVLQVNFRGSGGYGMSFIEKGKRQMGRAMQDDLTDAAEWAIANGYADPARIGIFGGSYGGYAAMQAMVSTPDLFRVGISFVGVFDLTRQISDYAHYGIDLAHEFWVDWVGDPETDRTELRAVSPQFHTDKIKGPVFLFHGYRDGQARINQAFEFSRALQRSRVELERVFLRNEGHGIIDEDNRVEVYTALEEFLRRHMPSDLMRGS